MGVAFILYCIPIYVFLAITQLKLSICAYLLHSVVRGEEVESIWWCINGYMAGAGKSG